MAIVYKNCKRDSDRGSTGFTQRKIKVTRLPYFYCFMIVIFLGPVYFCGVLKIKLPFIYKIDDINSPII